MLANFMGLVVRICRLSFEVTVVRSARLPCGVCLDSCDPDAVRRGGGALLAESEGPTSASSKRDNGRRGLEVAFALFLDLCVPPRVPSASLDISTATMAMHVSMSAHASFGRDGALRVFTLECQVLGSGMR